MTRSKEVEDRARLATRLAYQHHETGHMFPVRRRLALIAGLKEPVESRAECPECGWLAAHVTYRRKAIPIEKLFRR